MGERLVRFYQHVKGIYQSTLIASVIKAPQGYAFGSGCGDAGGATHPLYQNHIFALLLRLTGSGGFVA